MSKLWSFIESWLSFCLCREGSVVAHFWILLNIPSSHAEGVTLEKVRRSLVEGLKGYGRSKVEETASFDGYLFHLPTLSVSGERKNMGRKTAKGRFKFKFNVHLI